MESAILRSFFAKAWALSKKSASRGGCSERRIGLWLIACARDAPAPRTSTVWLMAPSMALPVRIVQLTHPCCQICL